VEAIDVAGPTSDCEVEVLMESRMMGRVGRRRGRTIGQVRGYLLILDFAAGLKSIFAARSALLLHAMEKMKTHLELVQFGSIQ
jgi:hypothetical protein